MDDRKELVKPSIESVFKGARPAEYLSFGGERVQAIDGLVAEESLVCVSLNGQELATYMCTPHDLDLLALGFLRNEGFISSKKDVRKIHVSQSRSCVDVWLYDTDVKIPDREIKTSGCGGGVTFDDLSEEYEPLRSDYSTTSDKLVSLMRQMLLNAEMYQIARGVHTAAMATEDEILLQVEDVGRHNCLDKLSGAAMMADQSTTDHIVLSSGRISSEMINKARRLEMPIVCSRTSPTSLSVALANKWNITIVAYLRKSRMRIYTHPERITDIV